MAENDPILEFIRVGTYMKVVAVDPATGIEVVSIGPANASHQLLTDNALRKLRYVLDKNR